MHGRPFRSQAVRAQRETRYYRQVFTEVGLDPRKRTYDDIASVPVTPKEALRDDGDVFVRSRSTRSVRRCTPPVS
jgi:phenylacetate-CoA ligase